MIREDRIALNERFIHVFRKLEEQKKIVKNDRSGKGVGDLAEKVLGNRAYGHIIRAFLRGDNKRVIDYGQAKKFCDIFKVNESYLLRGEGEPFGMTLQNVLKDSDNSPRDNEIYAIKTDGSLWVKYVKKIKDGQGRIIKLNLISANNLEHDPFEIEVSQFTRLYKVKSRINQVQR